MKRAAMLGAAAIAGAVGLFSAGCTHAAPGPYANPSAVAARISANLRPQYSGTGTSLTIPVTCVATSAGTDVCDFQVFLGKTTTVAGGPTWTGTVTAYVSADGSSFVTGNSSVTGPS